MVEEVRRKDWEVGDEDEDSVALVDGQGNR